MCHESWHGEATQTMPLPLQVTFGKDHLQAGLLSLGCDVRARERSNFESYPTRYERVLERVRQQLRQKEHVRRGQNRGGERVGVTLKRKIKEVGGRGVLM